LQELQLKVLSATLDGRILFNTNDDVDLTLI